MSGGQRTLRKERPRRAFNSSRRRVAGRRIGLRATSRALLDASYSSPPPSLDESLLLEGGGDSLPQASTT